MENRNFLKDLTRYRVKLEKDGKSVVDLPGILCLPGLLAAPRLSVASVIAAPLLGYSVRLENEDGKPADVVSAVQKTADTVMDTAAAAARTIREEIDKAWQSISADDPEPAECEEDAECGETAEAENAQVQESECCPVTVEEPDEIPTIHVDDSAQK